ncbi:hypothetical protein BJX65DRAFT_311644 [Aspergillus insuetus]
MLNQMPVDQRFIGADRKPTYLDSPDPEDLCKTATASVCTTTLSYGIVAKRAAERPTPTQAPQISFEEGSPKLTKRAVTTTTSTISFCFQVTGCSASEITTTTSIESTATTVARVVIPRDPGNTATIRGLAQVADAYIPRGPLMADYWGLVDPTIWVGPHTGADDDDDWFMDAVNSTKNEVQERSILAKRSKTVHQISPMLWCRFPDPLGRAPSQMRELTGSGNEFGYPNGYLALFGDPANCNYIPELIVVSGVFRNGHYSGYSDANRFTCYAPAYGLRLATLETDYDGYRTTSGTSYASATVAGLAAYFRGLNPTLTTAASVKEKIVELAYPRPPRKTTPEDYYPNKVIWNGQMNGESAAGDCDGSKTKRQSSSGGRLALALAAAPAAPAPSPLKQNPAFLDPRSPDSVQNPDSPYHEDWDGTITRTTTTSTRTSTTTAPTSTRTLDGSIGDTCSFKVDCDDDCPSDQILACRNGVCSCAADQNIPPYGTMCQSLQGCLNVYWRAPEDTMQGVTTEMGPATPYALAPANLDFSVSTSSTFGILGTLGQADYAAGNIFIDSLVRYRFANGQHGSSLVLPTVQMVGVVTENPDIQCPAPTGYLWYRRYPPLRHLKPQSQLGRPPLLDHVIVDLDPSKPTESLYSPDVANSFGAEDARFKVIMHTLNLIESAESSDSSGCTILKAIHKESLEEAVKLVSEHFTAQIARLLLLGQTSSSQK